MALASRQTLIVVHRYLYVPLCNRGSIGLGELRLVVRRLFISNLDQSWKSSLSGLFDFVDIDAGFPAFTHR